MDPDDIGNDEELDSELDSEVEIEVPVDTGKREFKIVPKGKNSLTIIDWERTKSNSGNDQLVFTFQNQDRIRMKDWFSLQPTALWRLAGLVMAIDPDVKAGDKIKLNKQKYLGRQFQGLITHQKNGEYVNPKLGKIEPHPDGFEPQEKDDLQF